ncbi:hypothetical protein MUP59_10360 [Candidatus Bathyarchaeota archaeon]|nr:hypothetical protein [Candidatus Bathyarchaeota archaeon]
MISDKPPVPVRVADIKNFARLLLAFSEGSQIAWALPHKGKYALCFFTAYMYWEGDLPLLAYMPNQKPSKPFLAYRSDGATGEECFYSDDFDDTKYRYASIITMKETPELFRRSLEGDYSQPPQPLMMEVNDVASLMRVLVPLSFREGTSFPVWHFVKGGTHNLGILIPFEHYYEADALPVLFHLKMNEPPRGPFLRYNALKPAGERVEFTSNTCDVKYFYAKLIDIERFPLLP